MTRRRNVRCVLAMVCALVAASAVVGGDMSGGDRAAPETFPAVEARLGVLVERTLRTGGFTVDPRRGTAPASGYAVATGRSTAQVEPAAAFFAGDGPRALRAYLREHADVLVRDPQLMVGAWYDRDGRRVVLSLVRVMPDRATAVHCGLSHHQRSVYDLSARRDVPTGLSPS
ncbi:hypothetical protein [Streptomyces camelliae]|uniref:Uncharacterized protein n=1 Tax=Streptomyces camelliae TaxID=3004093 RepID=A0ABY7NYU4_9ACTN|nr:hypothetical protein [Streptomyces sp. HUAS 2-6]WBO63425.1 hypothetical protein O1G22_11580 [Streptomyces sp. HUAS 2-6]